MSTPSAEKKSPDILRKFVDGSLEVNDTRRIGTPR